MNFSLRAWNMNDLDSLVKYANNANIAKNMTDQFPHPYKESNAKDFIMYATAVPPVHIFAIDVNGEAIGGIGVHPQSDVQRKNAELGYWLGEPFWGKGIITKAIPQVVDFAFKTFDINRVYARPFGTNGASKKVLEKTGFKREAHLKNSLFKNGEYVDELIYAVRKENWRV